MKIDFNKNRWSKIILFPTISLDFEYKTAYLVWLWFDIMIDWY